VSSALFAQTFAHVSVASAISLLTSAGEPECG